MESLDKILLAAVSTAVAGLLALMVYGIHTMDQNNRVLMEECMKDGNPRYYCRAMIVGN